MSVLHTFARKFNPRRNFDPSKIEDLRELKYFKENLTWKSGCPFYLEDPFLEIPAMCMSKYTDYMLMNLSSLTYEIIE
jgi:hypothetical protein